MTKDTENIFHEHWNTVFPCWPKDQMIELNYQQVYEIAKRFFEIGTQINMKNTTEK